MQTNELVEQVEGGWGGTFARAIFRLSSLTLVVQGWLLRGMSMMVVRPPAAAACVPVSIPVPHHDSSAPPLPAGRQLGYQHARQ